jgi:TonB family protein
MALAAKLGWRDPGDRNAKYRLAAFAGLAILGVLVISGMFILGRGPRVASEEELPESIVELIPDKPEEPKEEPKPEPKEDAGGASDQKPTNPNEGGSTENRTVAWPPSSPSSVMNSSVMDKLNTMSDGLQGEDIDPNQANALDVILAGGGGSMKKGERGGRGAGGDGDRMAGVGGIGLGTGGRAGFGTGNGGTRQGKMALGAGGTGKGIATRARIDPPKPSDVELGGEAGSRSPESILRVIRMHIGGFRYTYEKYLRDNQNIGGKISLKFTIAPSGDIIAISVVSSNTGNSSLDDEIKEKARRMKFDTIEKGNVTVTYAFVLDKQ